MADRTRQRRAVRLWLLCLLLLATACGKVELYSDLREREANEMLSLLLRAHIDTAKVTGKNGAVTLSVDSRRVPDAINILNNAGLPRERFTNMGELFRREGLITSPSEERVRYIYGVTQELSRTLTGLDGVLSARVHVVLPNNDPVSQPTARPSSAAVMIRYAPGASVEAVVPKIKELVVNSIEGLTYDRVSVVTVRAAEEDAGAAAAAPVPADGPPPLMLYGAAGLLALSVIGNALLGLLLWRGSPGRRLMPATS